MGWPALAGFLVAAALPGAAAGADSPPVLLRRTPLTTPFEAAGSGVAPEVKVRVTIGATGRVEKVDVIKIEPSTPYDEAFSRSTVHQLLLWRYAPARKAGQPSETTLEWSVQFLAKEAPEPQVGNEPLPPLPEGLDGERRARVARLSRERREALLRRYSEAAEKYLDAGRLRRARSPRFLVVSDAPEETTAAALAGNLEVTYNVLDGLFLPKVEPQPESDKVVAYVFWKKQALIEMQADIGAPGWTGGLYQAPGFLAFHLEVPTGDHLLHALIHEAFHAYADRHLARPGFHLPRWFDEGFAEYLGNSEIKKGELMPGRILKGKFLLSHLSGAYRLKTEAAWSLDEVKKSIRSGAALSVEQLVTADHTAFYGERREQYYPTSWLLVHFLRHGRPEWAEREFPALALYLAEGYPAGDALETAYGVALADLDEPFRAYAKGL